MEKIMSITSVRQNLMKLARVANRKMQRFVLTNKGEAEAVLIGYTDFKSLLASARLAHHPEVLQQTLEGFAEIKKGAGITLEEAFQQFKSANSGG